MSKKQETVLFFYDGEKVKLGIMDGKEEKGFVASLDELDQPQLELKLRAIISSLWVMTDTLGEPVK